MGCLVSLPGCLVSPSLRIQFHPFFIFQNSYESSSCNNLCAGVWEDGESYVEPLRRHHSRPWAEPAETGATPWMPPHLQDAGRQQGLVGSARDIGIGPESTQIRRFHFHRADPGSREGAEPGAAVQGVRGHQQWEALRHLRLQWLQRLLQAQRPQEAHLQVGAGRGIPTGQGMAGWAARGAGTLQMGSQGGKNQCPMDMKERTPCRAGTPGMATRESEID